MRLTILTLGCGSAAAEKGDVRALASALIDEARSTVRLLHSFCTQMPRFRMV